MIDALYRNGKLSAFPIFAERKAMLRVILSKDILDQRVISNLQAELKLPCAELDGDRWESEIVSLEDSDIGIINDTDDKVQPYLATIQMLWQLGRKDI